MSGITGGEIIARMLQQEGVEKVFGIIDGTYTQLLINFVGLGMQLITPRHESSAAHMAGAYSRLTGKLGVCIASNGPGVANMLSGVAVEQTEGNRVLLITSCRRTPLTYPDRGGAYQYFDQVGVIKNMAKWSATADSVGRFGELMRMALRQCYSGRPGVVHLDLPEDLINGKAPDTAYQQPSQYRQVDPIYPSPDAVARAAKLLATAKQPIIHAGSAVIHTAAYDELAELAEMLHAPVTTSWAARGALSEDNPLAWPMVHIKPVNRLRNEADLVLCLGSRLGETDWWAKPPYWAPPAQQKMIQVDIDPQALGRNRPMDLGVAADVKVFMRLVIEELKANHAAMSLTERKAGVAKLAVDRDKDRAKLDEKLADRDMPMITAHVGNVCRKVFDDDAVFVFDGGNTAVWANFFTKIVTPGTVLTTNHMGHLGAGVGQALGAAVARPDKQICCIIGDGAMGFHPQEIETAVRNKLKPIFLVIADKAWGMVKINQSFALKPVKTMWKKSLPEGETINTDLEEIAWDKLAESMGGFGTRISHPDDLEPALNRALESGVCAVIHVDVDPTKHMWAPGLLHFKDMHTEPKGK